MVLPMKGWSSHAVPPGMRAIAAAVVLMAAGCMPPSWGAGALLHPGRRLVERQPATPVETVDFDGAGVRLKGWWFHAAGTKRGTVIVMHGVADNRGSAVGMAEHFLAEGFDVVAYDSRAHGESGGDACTYGFYEKDDLRRVMDRVAGAPFVLIGTSLGAAVSLQAAAEDDRIAVVVAAATFSDLRSVAADRAPFFASKANIADALRIAEETAKFHVDEVSPVAAAARIHVPVLLLHGERDDETPNVHSRRIFAALHEPRRLIIVPGAGHNECYNGSAVWRDIDGWIEKALAARPTGSSLAR
jgi:alpha-beta hydrolase superfamily lysophospholipase